MEDQSEELTYPPGNFTKKPPTKPATNRFIDKRQTSSDPPENHFIDKRQTSSDPPPSRFIDKRQTSSVPPENRSIDKRQKIIEKPVVPVFQDQPTKSILNNEKSKPLGFEPTTEEPRKKYVNSKNEIQTDIVNSSIDNITREIAQDEVTYLVIENGFNEVGINNFLFDEINFLILDILLEEENEVKKFSESFCKKYLGDEFSNKIIDKLIFIENLKASEEKVESLKKINSDLLKQLRSLEKFLPERTLIANETEENLKIYNSKIIILSENYLKISSPALEKEQSKLEVLEKEYLDVLLKTEEIKNQKKEQMEMIEKLKDEIEDKNKQNSVLWATIQKIDKEKRVLQIEIDNLGKEEDLIETEIEKLQIDLINFKEKIKANQQEIGKIEQEVDFLDRNIQRKEITRENKRKDLKQDVDELHMLKNIDKKKESPQKNYTFLSPRHRNQENSRNSIEQNSQTYKVQEFEYQRKELSKELTKTKLKYEEYHTKSQKNKEFQQDTFQSQRKNSWKIIIFGFLIALILFYLTNHLIFT